jgi:hypothetical protein
MDADVNAFWSKSLESDWPSISLQHEERVVEYCEYSKSGSALKKLQPSPKVTNNEELRSTATSDRLSRILANCISNRREFSRRAHMRGHAFVHTQRNAAAIDDEPVRSRAFSRRQHRGCGRRSKAIRGERELAKIFRRRGLGLVQQHEDFRAGIHPVNGFAFYGRGAAFVSYTTAPN